MSVGGTVRDWNFIAGFESIDSASRCNRKNKTVLKLPTNHIENELCSGCQGMLSTMFELGQTCQLNFENKKALKSPCAVYSSGYCSDTCDCDFGFWRGIPNGLDNILNMTWIKKTPLSYIVKFYGNQSGTYFCLSYRLFEATLLEDGYVASSKTLTCQSKVGNPCWYELLWCGHGAIVYLYKWRLTPYKFQTKGLWKKHIYIYIYIMVPVPYCLGVGFWIKLLFSVEEVAWWSLQDGDYFVFFPEWSHTVIPKSWLVWCSNDTCLRQPIHRGP